MHVRFTGGWVCKLVIDNSTGRRGEERKGKERRGKGQGRMKEGEKDWGERRVLHTTM